MATKKATKNSEKSAMDKRLANLKNFKKGQSGNPNGRPLGVRNRRTVLWAAIHRIAEKKKMDPEEFEELIQAAGIEKAVKGSFFHYQEVSNGLYGKIQDKLDITSDGVTLAELIQLANDGRQSSTTKRKKRTATSGKNTK